MQFFSQFGGKITPELKERYAKSERWIKKKFYNYERTGIDIKAWEIPQLVYKQLFSKKGRIPKLPLPILDFDVEQFLSPSEKAKFVWFGHSVLLIRIAGKTLLIDPMFGPNAAPVSPFAVPRFSENTLDIIDTLPPIDLVLLTHDHYDHLDMASINLLKPKVKQYYVALGASRHLQKWGISSDVIREFDWWEQHTFNELNITFTPTRHASGRAISDQSCCLWGGWAITSPMEKIWFSGDGGYGSHFTEIGKQLGPFDFAFLECGQYNTSWHDIHMYPEEAVQAAEDVGVGKIMPVHWGGFALAMHHWKEPINRFTSEAQKKNYLVSTPPIGQLFSVADRHDQRWWDNFE